MKRQRAYIGNLRPRTNLAERIYLELCVPSCLSVKNYPPKTKALTTTTTSGGDHDYGGLESGIIIARPKPRSSFGLDSSEGDDKPHSVFALVEFDDVEYAVGVLNGVQFDGRILRVSKEKKQKKQGNGGFKFGSNRWSVSSNVSKDWDSKRQSRGNEVSNVVSKEGSDDNTEDVEEKVAKEVGSIIASEIKNNSEGDEITAAIACTAAVAMLSSVDAFVVETTRHDEPDSRLAHDEFRSRCQMPLSELLAEYGEQDVNWKKQSAPPKTNSTSDHSFNSKIKHSPSSDNSNNSNRNKKENNDNNNNRMLAPFGKAPINIEIQSFGYKYGVPPNEGFSHAHPLPPLDVRDLDRAPPHVAKFDGSSNRVKRALLNAHREVNEPEGNANGRIRMSPMRQRANDIADEIMKALVESIDVGGHGSAFPLNMTVFIGSEYGRHRSVVLADHVADIVRARLRRNGTPNFHEAAECVVREKTSVGARHRDIAMRHKDEEAYGTDLKREAKVEKAKRRQRKEELGWGNDDDDDDHW